MVKKLEVKDIILGKVYQFKDEEFVKKEIRGKRVKVVQVDNMIGEMDEDGLPSRKIFNRFVKGQRVSIFPSILEEI